jgi:hypothetical protein
MDSTYDTSAIIGDEVVMRPRRRATYGHWVPHIIDTNDQSGPEIKHSQPAPTLAPSGRGRGRPRVNKVRDASAIEVNNTDATRFKDPKLNARRNVARKYEKLSARIRNGKIVPQQQTSDALMIFCKSSPTSLPILRHCYRQPQELA